MFNAVKYIKSHNDESLHYWTYTILVDSNSVQVLIHCFLEERVNNYNEHEYFSLSADEVNIMNIVFKILLIAYNSQL